ncbi:MAG: hypothetical protein IPN71_10765 [Fibrobacteres bacterium]|nr:hypothetical protein [Fibrobacterota bacterium]
MLRKSLGSLAFAMQTSIFLVACQGDPLPSASSAAPQELDPSSGQVALSLNLGPVGVLARTAEMSPRRLVLQFKSGGETLSDTIAVTGTGTVAKTYTMASQRDWTLEAIGLDQRDSTLYQGSTSFTVMAKKTTSVSLSLSSKHSSIKVKFPIIDSLTRFVLSVDGSVWGDSSVVKQTRVGDTIKMDHDYLAASPAGIVHDFDLRIFGQPWGVDTLCYALDTSVAVVSGRNQGHVFKAHWVGAKTPPPGFAELTVILGAVGLVDVQVVYEDTAFTSVNDFGIPWNPNITYGKLQDPRDGKVYRTVQIGTQTWMAENLNYEIGTSWCYSNVETNCEKYGRLYDWASARVSAPPNWHLPSDAEWMQLEFALGMSSSQANVIGWRGAASEAYKLKATAGWITKDGSDSFGFRAIPGGWRHDGGAFASPNTDAAWWTSSASSSTTSWHRGIYDLYSTINREQYRRGFGFSVRLVRD